MIESLVADSTHITSETFIIGRQGGDAEPSWCIRCDLVAGYKAYQMFVIEAL